jgi:tetratricopeptide (TPR) repeat protein
VLIDQLQLEQALDQIELGLKLVKQIGAKRFEPFLLESLSRIYLWQGKHAQAIETIDRGIKLLADVNAETFIGPWLLATKALLCTQKTQADSYLKQGQFLLDQGCIGHNYYRFYIAAIEVNLQLNDLVAAKSYINKLQKFTENEPTPWSEFYINRAKLIISINQNQANTDLQMKIKNLIQHAKKINLLTAIPRLEQALTSFAR